MITSEEYMVLDEISQIEEFPKELTLTGAPFEVGAIGVKSLTIVDSLMFFCTSNPDSPWVVSLLIDQNVLASMLKIGQGPGEFVFAPSVSNNVTFTHFKDGLNACIFNGNQGSILRFNIDSCLLNSQAISGTWTTDLPNTFFSTTIINDSQAFCRELGEDHRHFERYLYDNSDGEKAQNDMMKKLDQAHVYHGDNLNILSTMSKYNPELAMIVEMPIALNYINLYSLDGSTGKTICMGKELFNIREVEGMDQWDRIYTFADLRIYSTCWGVHGLNVSEKEYQTQGSARPTLYIFNWKGEPLIKIHLQHPASVFDFDSHTGTLYTFDVNSESFYRYSNDELTALFTGR